MKTLDDILYFNFNCKSAFLNKPRRNEDGSVNPFTKSGAKAYGKLIDVLYSVEQLVENEDYKNCINEVVEELDNICDSNI